MNLIRKYTVNGSVRIDADDLSNPRKTIIPIYNRKGERYADYNVTASQRRAGKHYGVHKANLFDSLNDAIANRERILAELFPEVTP